MDGSNCKKQSLGELNKHKVELLSGKKKIVESRKEESDKFLVAWVHGSFRQSCTLIAHVMFPIL